MHLYFNPLYEGKSPLCHGLIYYLGGSLGRDFNWFISMMHDYLLKYPDTDISKFQTLRSKDKLLHNDNVVSGLICKLVYDKDGINGLKRVMNYKTFDEVFLKEFSVKPNDGDKFLKGKFRNTP